MIVEPITLLSEKTISIKIGDKAYPTLMLELQLEFNNSFLTYKVRDSSKEKGIYRYVLLEREVLNDLPTEELFNEAINEKIEVDSIDQCRLNSYGFVCIRVRAPGGEDNLRFGFIDKHDEELTVAGVELHVPLISVMV